MANTTHIVKCWPDYYDAIIRGDKTFDVRLDDRGYQRGDLLCLRWYKIGDGYKRNETTKSGYEETTRKITYILTGGHFGIEPRYVVLALAENPNP
jgi:hypothetical protein